MRLTPPKKKPLGRYLPAYNFALFHRIASEPDPPPPLTALSVRFQGEISGPLEGDDAAHAIAGIDDALHRRAASPPRPDGTAQRSARRPSAAAGPPSPRPGVGSLRVAAAVPAGQRPGPGRDSPGADPPRRERSRRSAIGHQAGGSRCIDRITSTRPQGPTAGRGRVRPPRRRQCRGRPRTRGRPGADDRGSPTASSTLAALPAVAPRARGLPGGPRLPTAVPGGAGRRPHDQPDLERLDEYPADGAGQDLDLDFGGPEPAQIRSAPTPPAPGHRRRPRGIGSPSGVAAAVQPDEVDQPVARGNAFGTPRPAAGPRRRSASRSARRAAASPPACRPPAITAPRSIGTAPRNADGPAAGKPAPPARPAATTSTSAHKSRPCSAPAAKPPRRPPPSPAWLASSNSVSASFSRNSPCSGSRTELVDDPQDHLAVEEIGERGRLPASTGPARISGTTPPCPRALWMAMETSRRIRHSPPIPLMIARRVQGRPRRLDRRQTTRRRAPPGPAAAPPSAPRDGPTPPPTPSPWPPAPAGIAACPPGRPRPRRRRPSAAGRPPRPTDRSTHGPCAAPMP